jgi:hypothetical protein
MGTPNVRSDNFTIGPVTLAFPHLFNPQRPKGSNGDLKYNTGCVITQDIYNQILPHLQGVVGKAFSEAEWSSRDFEWGVHPCTEKADTYPVAAERGMFYFNAKSGEQYPPQVVDANRQPVVDPGKVRDGTLAYISINVWSFVNAGNKGVSIGMGPVMIWGEGEVLNTGGGPSAQSAFANIPGAPAPAAGAAAGAPIGGGIPQQQPMQQPVQQPMQQPVQQPMQQPVQQPMQQPVQQPMQQPVQQPMQQPVQQPMQQSTPVIPPPMPNMG